MSYVDSAFANTPSQGLLPPPQQVGVPQQAPQAPGIFGQIGNAARGILGLPGAYVNAIGTALSDVPKQFAFQQQQREMAQRQAMAIYQQVMAIPDPVARMAAMANLPEYGKALAQNYAPQSITGGNSVQFGGPGGLSVTAPLQGMTASGQGYSQTPTATTATGALPTIQKTAPGESVTTLAPAGAAAGNVGASAFGQGPGPTIAGPDQTPAPTPATGGATGASIDPIGFFKAFVLKHEGGLNPSDMNGSPTNYGINQAAHPGINVKTLTPDGAAQIFKSDYWNRSGAANLSAPLAAVHADTFFINPAKATQFLRQSGGDWQKYMQLRQSWMASMEANNPAAAKYTGAWTSRNSDLTKVAAGLAGGGAPDASTPAPTGLPTSIQGKTNQRISPADAMAQGLAPGQWELDPTGHKVQVSKPSDAEMAQLGTESATVNQLRDLVQQQQQFLVHNAAYDAAHGVSTGLGTADWHIPFTHAVNPMVTAGESNSADYRAMAASEAAQALSLKPPATGQLRVSELPYLDIQAQSPGAKYEANQSALFDNQRKLTRVMAQQQFNQHWVYQYGNLKDASPAFNDWWSKNGSSYTNRIGQSGGSAQSTAPGARVPQGIPAGAPTATGPGGHTIYSDGTRWLDATTHRPVGQ